MTKYKQNYKKKRGRRKANRQNRRIINDVPKNDTNIRVRFKKAITLAYASNQAKLDLNPGISTLTKDLAVVYKLYRCTHLKLTFQAPTFEVASQISQPRFAINYVPALEATTTAPVTIEDYEGPAIGFWQDARGCPYTWTVPSNVLNAMPYNWYETKSNTPSVTDLTQGSILSTCDLVKHFETALLEVVFEFQTLEDPDFLASIVHNNQAITRPEMIRAKARHQMEEYDQIDNEDLRRSDSAESRSFRNRCRV